MMADAVQNDSEAAKKLSFARLQFSTIEELELRLAIAGVASLDAAVEAWSRENKDIQKIIYKHNADIYSELSKWLYAVLESGGKLSDGKNEMDASAVPEFMMGCVLNDLV